MIAANRVAGSKRPRVVGTGFSPESSGVRPALSFERGEVWQDALDPELPAEPAPGVRQQALLGSRPSAHKLILMGLVLGAGLQALGYFGAAYLF